MCGIFAIFSFIKNKNIGNEIMNGLQLLQHRGKDGYGIAYYTNDNFKVIKNKGEVNNLELNIDSDYCIGHTRYSTSGYTMDNGKILKEELQPLQGVAESLEFYLVHNGNIPTVEGHDTSYLIGLINSLDNLSIEDILIFIMNKIPAAYCLILMFKDKMYAVRDRFGVRPLCIGQRKSNYYVSSESYGLGKVPLIRNVSPGEIVKFDKFGMKTVYKHPKSQLSLCTFEILYFSNENSIIDGFDIGNSRKQLATKLAMKEKTGTFCGKDYVVIGIPETGKLLGQTYADVLKLDYKQWISKNPNVSRTFILKTTEERKEACMKKFFYNESQLKGKKVIIVDDTIVRGTVISAIIQNLRKIGVAEVHVRIPAPPVIDRCILGIAIQDKKELIMTNRTVDEVAYKIKADSLCYLTLNDISDIVPKKSYNLCFSGYIDDSMIYDSTISTRILK